jgi:hypothetical protein
LDIYITAAKLLKKRETKTAFFDNYAVVQKKKSNFAAQFQTNNYLK